jgi:hypothetical protein
MKRKKPSQTRRHRESVREKRRARAFYFERQAAKGAEGSEDSLQHESDRWWKTLVDVCGSVFAGLAAAWLVYGIIQLIGNS